MPESRFAFFLGGFVLFCMAALWIFTGLVRNEWHTLAGGWLALLAASYLFSKVKNKTNENNRPIAPEDSPHGQRNRERDS
jgi:hypothetical protein